MNRKELLINHLRRSSYQLMDDDVFNIANELREYDNDLILFFNPKSERYEIHSCAFFPYRKVTYCVSSDSLEDIFFKLKQADNRVTAFEEKMRQAEESKLREEIKKAKKEEDLRENFVKEVAKADTTHFIMR